MLLTITTTHEPATDIGFLLRKNPSRPQSFDLTFGKAPWRAESLPTGKFRHRDHRFEWTRPGFQEWANRVAARCGYAVRFLPVGPEDPVLGSPTQMGVFTGHIPKAPLRPA